ncbi:15551_t:CDS:2, partial [Cetraspora pellucida]
MDKDRTLVVVSPPVASLFPVASPSPVTSLSLVASSSPIASPSLVALPSPIASSSLVVLLPFDEDTEETFVDSDYKLAIKELQQTLDALNIQNPLLIKDLLEFEEKNIEVHQQFNNKALIEAAIEIKHIENKVVIELLTRKEQLNILCNALRIVDERIDD